MSPMHAHHEALPDYSPDAILQDGCEKCEQRSKDIRGALDLDHKNFPRMWNLMLAFNGVIDAPRPVSRCDARMCNLLWPVYLMRERYFPTEDMREPLREPVPENSISRALVRERQGS